MIGRVEETSASFEARSAPLLDPGGDVQRPHVAKGSNAGLLAPIEKVLYGR
jgi:hypothetical protein